MTPEQAYLHCVKCGRNAELEKFILTDPEWAYLYTLDFIKNRWPEAEDIIKKDPYFAYCYARHVIEGRWIEAENIILTSSEYSYYYARDVIKGKLPENMHNMMLLCADRNSKAYFNLLP